MLPPEKNTSMPALRRHISAPIKVIYLYPNLVAKECLYLKMIG